MVRRKGTLFLKLIFFLWLLGLGLAITGQSWLDTARRSREKILLSRLETIQRGIYEYSAEKGSFPPTLEELKKGRFFRDTDPTDPLTGKPLTPLTAKGGVYTIKSQAPGTAFKLGLAYQALTGLKVVPPDDSVKAMFQGLQ